jgi:hypothetical protein
VNIRITGSGKAACGYKVELDGVECRDIMKIAVFYDAKDFVRAEMTVFVDDLDVVGELNEIAQADAAKRAEILFDVRGHKL